MCEISLSVFIFFCLSTQRNSRISFSCLCQEIKPTVLIGTSGKGGQFTKQVVEAMAAINEVFCPCSHIFFTILNFFLHPQADKSDVFVFDPL